MKIITYRDGVKIGEEVVDPPAPEPSTEERLAAMQRYNKALVAVAILVLYVTGQALGLDLGEFDVAVQGALAALAVYFVPNKE